MHFVLIDRPRRFDNFSSCIRKEDMQTVQTASVVVSSMNFVHFVQNSIDFISAEFTDQSVFGFLEKILQPDFIFFRIRKSSVGFHGNRNTWIAWVCGKFFYKLI